jgi:molybdopterin synthase catalytic subunit
MVAITEHPIELESLLREILTPGTGGIDVFVGTVRDNNEGKRVEAIEYTAYVPMAENLMRRIEEEIRGRWRVCDVRLLHRIGLLRVGETSVLTAVSAPHRAEAFEACRHAIERIKADVPIWKKELP